MLCATCGMHPATTGEGLCDGCAVAAANAAPPPAGPAMPISGPIAVLRSPVGLGRAVVTLLCVILVFDVVAVAVVFNLGQALDSSQGLSGYSIERIERIEQWVNIVEGLTRLVYLATIVVFIVWFYRVRGNAQVFAPDLLTRGRGWAIGGWFIPIGNLFIPFGIAAEVWRASRKDPYIGAEPPFNPVNLWWTALLASWFFTKLANFRIDTAESLPEVGTAFDLLIVACLVEVAAAVLAALFVHKLTQMQHTKALRGAEPAVAVA